MVVSTGLRQSAQIVISGDHERDVIGVCGYILIDVIICRPWFMWSVLLQLSDKITGSQRKSHCIRLSTDGEVASLGSNTEGRKLGVSKSKDEYLLLGAQKQLLTLKQQGR